MDDLDPRPGYLLAGHGDAPAIFGDLLTGEAAALAVGAGDVRSEALRAPGAAEPAAIVLRVRNRCPGRALRLTKSDANRTESRRRLICGRAAKASARTIRIGWLRTFCSLSRDTESYRGLEPRALSWPSYGR